MFLLFNNLPSTRLWALCWMCSYSAPLCSAWLWFYAQRRDCMHGGIPGCLESWGWGDSLGLWVLVGAGTAWEGYKERRCLISRSRVMSSRVFEFVCVCVSVRVCVWMCVCMWVCLWKWCSTRNGVCWQLQQLREIRPQVCGITLPSVLPSLPASLANSREVRIGPKVGA